ncbi:MAG: glycosyltransferase family 2 protein [Chloroflexi bacterium]|nr:glycosyltransferase family 2 protein [Chloroflexota bacterium]
MQALYAYQDQKRDYPYEISVVLPVYNEEDNLRPLHEELSGVLDSMDIDYEIIYVDDGSRDRSPEIMRELAEQSPQVKAVFLRRNFGQTAAIQAGIDQATGAIITLMDSDLQNDPAAIPLMKARMDEGFDLVSGWRKNRKDRMLTRRIPSIAANWVISRVTNVYLHDYGCTLKMYRRELLDHVRLYGEMHRFIPVLAWAAGAKLDEMVVNHRPRIHGKSKYGLYRTAKVVLDLMTVTFLTKFNTRPMYIFGGAGFLFGGLGILAFIFMILHSLITSIPLVGTPLPVFSAVFIVGGTQSILLGLIIEMLMRTYYESQHKGPYTIREIISQPQVAEEEMAFTPSPH